MSDPVPTAQEPPSEPHGTLLASQPPIAKLTEDPKDNEEQAPNDQEDATLDADPADLPALPIMALKDFLDRYDQRDSHICQAANNQPASAKVSETLLSFYRSCNQSAR